MNKLERILLAGVMGLSALAAWRDKPAEGVAMKKPGEQERFLLFNVNDKSYNARLIEARDGDLKNLRTNIKEGSKLRVYLGWDFKEINGIYKGTVYTSRIEILPQNLTDCNNN